MEKRWAQDGNTSRGEGQEAVRLTRVKAAWGSRKGVAGMTVTFMGCRHRPWLSL